jgi:hypothetical protein
MAVHQEDRARNAGEDAAPESQPKIDPKAPAGSKKSLGAESVRDGRPSTDDGVVEAMDEESPDITAH